MTLIRLTLQKPEISTGANGPFRLVKVFSLAIFIYTEYFTKAVPTFLVAVPISPVLGLPFHEARARVKFMVPYQQFRNRNALILQN